MDKADNGEEPEEEEDTRPEECKTKIEGLETDLTTVEGQCDAQSSQLAMLQAMIAAQTTIVNPISETINSNVSLIAGCSTANEEQNTLLTTENPVQGEPDLSLSGRLNALQATLTEDGTGL